MKFQVPSSKFQVPSSKFQVLILCLSIFLSGCAQRADSIQASYVSPLTYSDYSCHQLRKELTRISHKVNEISGVQDKTATGDAWATGVGLVLFWPALFFIAHDDQHVQLAELKGQYDAIFEQAIKKNCDIAKQLKAAEEERNRKKAQKEKEQAEQAKMADINR